MKAAIDKLLNLEATSKCNEVKNHFISPIFMTPKNTGGYRFILNLKKNVTNELLQTISKWKIFAPP